MLTYQMATARTWAEINLDHLLHNYHMALGLLGEKTRHFSVLKANAYGLGAVPVAKALYEEGARVFAMACVSEALELRHALPEDAEIFVMSEAGDAEIPWAVESGFVLTVFSLEKAKKISEEAVRRNRKVRIHCKVDTGLHRLGFPWEAAVEEISKVCELPGLEYAGLFSHLQRRSPEFDMEQARRLEEIRDRLLARGIQTPLLHLVDSIGMWRYPQYQFDAVRDAAFLIGSTREGFEKRQELKFALTFKTRVIRVHWAKAGETLGYDGQRPLKRDTRVATLSVGYADGYPRGMSGCAQVEIGGKRAPLLDGVCMDLCCADVTELPEVQVGDEVILLGSSISLNEYAGFAGLYGNEVITMISRRVPRIYIRNGETTHIEGYLG